MSTNPKTKPYPVAMQTRDAPGPVGTTGAMKSRLLVVDDDRQIRESLRNLF